MNIKLMTRNLSPEGVLALQLSLVQMGAYEGLRELISNTGFYPEVFNAIVLTHSDEEATRTFIKDLLGSVKDGSFDAGTMRYWLEGYFGDDWEQVVVDKGFLSVAVEFFAVEECVKFNMLDALKKKGTWEAYEAIYRMKNGLVELEKYYDELQQYLNTVPGQSDEERMALESRKSNLAAFLANVRHYSFLVERQDYDNLFTQNCIVAIGCKKAYWVLLQVMGKNFGRDNQLFEKCLEILSGVKDLLSPYEIRQYEYLKGRYAKELKVE